MMRNRGKKLALLCFLLFLCLGFLPETVRAEVLYGGTDGDLTWSVDGDGVLTIEGTGDYKDHPWTENDCSEVITSAVVKVKGITSTEDMFEGCNRMTEIDLSELDTSRVTNMGCMFSGCSSLTSLDVSGFDTSHVTDMRFMFEACSSLASLDVSEFDTSRVIKMCYMFSGCSSLTSLDVSGFATSKVIDLGCMFEGCSGLTSLNVSGFNTSKVTDMYCMFEGCSNLTGLDVSGFDTSRVTEIGAMFEECSGLTSLDVSGFDTSCVEYMNHMFYGCSGLKSLDVSGFSTSRVKDMSYMFYGCSSLTSLDVSGFTTSRVTDMSSMFFGCSALTTLDLSSFCLDALKWEEDGEEIEDNWATPDTVDANGMIVWDGTCEVVKEMLTGCTGLISVKAAAGLAYAVKLPDDGACYWVDGGGAVCTYIEAKQKSAVTYTKRFRDSSSGGIYALTSKNTATWIAPTSTTVKKTVIPASITVNSVTYKVTAVGAEAFRGNKKLTSVTIGSKVTSIGARAFYGCTALTTVKIPSAVKTWHSGFRKVYFSEDGHRLQRCHQRGLEGLLRGYEADEGLRDDEGDENRQ